MFRSGSGVVFTIASSILHVPGCVRKVYLRIHTMCVEEAHVHTYTYMHIHTYTHVHVHAHTYIHTHTCTHIHVHE